MLSLRDLWFDNASLGKTLLLVEVKPVREFKNNRSTDVVLGYKYDVCLAEHHLEKISVRIDGPQLLTSPESGAVEVVFSELRVSAYQDMHDKSVHFMATATGISLKNPDKQNH